MRIAGDDCQRRAQAALRLWSVSLLAVSALVSGAQAGDRPSGRDPRCIAAGEGLSAIEGVDGCFRPGTHVRVERQVMQGAARMSGALPYSTDGAAPAALRSDAGTTRLRMRPLPGDIFAR